MAFCQNSGKFSGVSVLKRNWEKTKGSAYKKLYHVLTAPLMVDLFRPSFHFVHLPVTPHLCSRPQQDVTQETSNNELYNEDDRHLIESIEKEFLITQDNFLPGQIVN